jgi:hypothetical protein
MKKHKNIFEKKNKKPKESLKKKTPKNATQTSFQTRGNDDDDDDDDG